MSAALGIDKTGLKIKKMLNRTVSCSEIVWTEVRTA